MPARHPRVRLERILKQRRGGRRWTAPPRLCFENSLAPDGGPVASNNCQMSRSGPSVHPDCGDGVYGFTTSSTRRFCARPSAVVVARDRIRLAEAVGRSGGCRITPALEVVLAPELARRSDRRWLYASVPTRIGVAVDRDGRRRAPPSASSPPRRGCGTASGRMLDLSKSKFTPRSTIFFFIGGAAATGGRRRRGRRRWLRQEAMAHLDARRHELGVAVARRRIDRHLIVAPEDAERGAAPELIVDAAVDIEAAAVVERAARRPVVVAPAPR